MQADNQIYYIPPSYTIIMHNIVRIDPLDRENVCVSVCVCAHIMR